MGSARTVRITAPQAAILLRAVHNVRDRLGVDNERVRRLTRILAEAAGVPADAVPWPSAALPDESLMASIRQAITGHLLLHLRHLRQDAKVAESLVEPYHVRLESGYWFLLSRDAVSRRERVFRIDKIKAAEVGEQFGPSPIDLDHYLDGVFVPEDPGQYAVVALGPHGAPDAVQRWGRSTLLPDGRSVVHIPYQREHWLVRTLMEYRDDIEVLEPEAVREGVRDRALATLRAYQESDA
jgi:predicted DNA-binding transcriptional regulator YafY